MVLEKNTVQQKPLGLMTTLTQDLKDKIGRLNVFEKIIGVNVLIFIIGLILSQVFYRLGSLSWIDLPVDIKDVLFKPWSIITYGFVHYDFWHLFFNMLVLYFVAKMLTNLFNIKLLLNIYFLGIICGALLFILVFNLIPNQFLKPASGLVGASAGVRALLIFLCAYMAKTEVKIFTFNVKLMYIGFVLVATDTLGLLSGLNQGGYIAHFGGVILGYYYATQLLKGKDIGKGFENIMDKLINLFKKKSNLKTAYKSKTKVGGYTKGEFNEFNKQKQINLILDKISKSGYESLTEEEKAFLFRAGKD